MQTAQRFNFSSNFLHQRRQLNTRIATLEFVRDLRTRKLMQDGLHHGELVQVRIEQTGNNHYLPTQWVNDSTVSRGVIN